MKKVKAKNKSLDIMLNVFAWLSFFLAVVLAVMVFLSTFSGTENGKAIFGYKMLIVESGSMSKSPTSEDEKIFFSTGDVIIIKEVDDPSTIKEGDVIAFVSHNAENQGETVSHKVRSVKTDARGQLVGFETYGINTGASDEIIVDPSTVIGKYVSKLESLGTLFKFFKTPAGYFTSILVPCLLLIIFFSVEVGKLLGRKETADSYDVEIEELRRRMFQLETEERAVMQANLNETTLSEKMENEFNKQELDKQIVGESQAACVCAEAAQPISRPVIQMPTCQASVYNDKQLELTVNALNHTIETLTRTIEALAVTVEKPVETLARTVETLANAATKPTVVEKTAVQPEPQPESQPVAQPVVQPVVQPIVIQPVVQPVVVQPAPQPESQPIVQSPVQPVVEPVVQPIVEPEAQPAASEIPAPNVQPSSAVEIPETEQTEAVAGPASFRNLAPAREKVPFNKKLLSLDSEIKNYFSDIHNQLISYKKVKYRVSFRGIAYRIGRKTLAKMIVRGKTLKLHIALNVDDYPKTVFFQEDSSDVKMYENVPFTVKIKSNRGKNNALKLINHLAENNSLVGKEKFKNENVLEQLKKLK